jgi:hypothetical protein
MLSCSRSATARRIAYELVELRAPNTASDVLTIRAVVFRSRGDHTRDHGLGIVIEVDSVVRVRYWLPGEKGRRQSVISDS